MPLIHEEITTLSPLARFMRNQITQSLANWSSGNRRHFVEKIKKVLVARRSIWTE